MSRRFTEAEIAEVSESPAATPREISSRPVKDKCRNDRLRTGGRTPPHDSTNARIEAADPPGSRPINRFRITRLPPIPNLNPLLNSESRHNNHLDKRPHSHRHGLRSPPETTADMGGCEGQLLFPRSRSPGCGYRPLSCVTTNSKAAITTTAMSAIVIAISIAPPGWSSVSNRFCNAAHQARTLLPPP